MKGISIFAYRIDYDSGVVVSIRHLIEQLKKRKINYELFFYKNDEELIEKVRQSHYTCINIQGLQFKDETLDQIVTLKSNITISIHSTICNLQVEEQSFLRLLKLAQNHPQLKFTCPSYTETQGLSTCMKADYRFLPNTFSYPVSEKECQKKIEKKLNLNRPLKISLVCAYRPMKNMLTQVAALMILAKERPVELHLLDTNQKSLIYHEILEMTKQSELTVVMHEARENKKCFELEGTFDLGLQVSLTETFSYVAFEHMIQGVPVIASNSVPFASEIADYSDVLDIKRKIEHVLSNTETYQMYCINARKEAIKVAQYNNQIAQDCIEKLIEGE